jgi:hypothetical protein
MMFVSPHASPLIHGKIGFKKSFTWLQRHALIYNTLNYHYQGRGNIEINTRHGPVFSDRDYEKVGYCCLEDENV